MTTTVKPSATGQSLELCIRGGAGPGGKAERGNRYDYLTLQQARILAYTLLAEAEKRGSK